MFLDSALDRLMSVDSGPDLRNGRWRRSGDRRLAKVLDRKCEGKSVGGVGSLGRMTSEESS